MQYVVAGWACRSFAGSFGRRVWLYVVVGGGGGEGLSAASCVDVCPVGWDVASIGVWGGGGAHARIPAPGLPSPVDAIGTVWGILLLPWFVVLLMLCGAVVDEW